MTTFESNLPTVIEELQAKDVALDAKDVDLQNQIDSEVVARTNADKLLQVNIDSEINDRNIADKSLQNKIDFVMKYLVPVGAIEYFARTAAPESWLKADGSAVSRTQYPNLFAAVGTMFGAGDGSTTFTLPDLRGEFIRGFDDGRGVDSGHIMGTWQGGMVESHEHSISCLFGGQPLGQGFAPGNPSTDRYATGQTYPTGGSETRPRNIALLACIKY